MRISISFISNSLHAIFHQVSVEQASGRATSLNFYMGISCREGGVVQRCTANTVAMFSSVSHDSFILEI